MGLLDNIKKSFIGSKNTKTVQVDDSSKKIMLATKIINLRDKIKSINSFDSSIWNLSNATTNNLQRRSLAELEKICSTLNARLSEITEQSKKSDLRRETLEKSKWTGQKPKNMTDYEFDRFQR